VSSGANGGSEASLERAFSRLRQLVELPATEAPYATEQRNFTTLAKAVEAVAAGTRVHAPRSSRRERALEAWDTFIQGNGELSRVDSLALCWEPEVAVTSQFCARLRSLPRLKGGSLRGLMASYHEAWPADDSDIDRVLRRNLVALTRVRGAVEQWQDHMPELLGKVAPRNFAKGCMEQKTSASRRLDEMSLGPSTSFAQAAAEELSCLLGDDAGDPEVVRYALGRVFVDDNDLLSPRVWGDLFHQIVKANSRSLSLKGRQVLIDLALKTRRLSDPRIESSAWANVPTSTTQEIMRWLSEEDLKFFFDLLMEGQVDPQGRHKFWIDYASSALRSCVVVGAGDEARLRKQLDEITSRGRTYARLKAGGGAQRSVSAFIMDFGEVTIVEFSKPNSACFIYSNDEDAPYLDLNDAEFQWAQLKNTREGEYHAHAHDWPSKFRRILAQYGIRPR